MAEKNFDVADILGDLDAGVFQRKLSRAMADMRDSTVVFVEPSGIETVAVLDHGTIDLPEWGDDKAILTLKQTPIYSAILSACARKHSQESMIEFLEDWSDELAPFLDVEASNPASVRQAISAVRRLKIKAKGDKTIEQGDMRASMSAMEEIEAQGDTDPLPVLIQYTGPIYEGLGAYTVAMRLKVHLNKEAPEFGLRVMSAEKLADQIAKDITAKIAGEVGCQVYTGKSSFSR